MAYSETALKVYNKLYFRNGDNDDPHNVHARVAKFAALGDEEVEKRLLRWMDEGFMRPNTPTLMNAGYLPEPQTSACFVGDLRDDLRSILQFDMEAGLIYNKGSGIGANYGNLREINAPLSRGGESSGPFAFLRKHAMTGWAIKSGGAARRAAAMGMMYDDHPDILKWIEFKATNKDRIVINGEEVPLFDGVNLSVAASDAFMQAALAGQSWELRGVVNRQVKQIVDAKKMLRLIVENACKCGDPGIWFIDRANRDNTLPSLGRIDATNPCNEQALHPRMACALASINLAKFVTFDGDFAWGLFRSVIADVTTMQDNLIDISGYPTPDYKDMAVMTRPVGIGLMGLADALVLMGMPYDSNEGIEFAGYAAKYLTREVIKTSACLAKEKGVFPAYHENRDAVLNVASRFFEAFPFDSEWDNDLGFVEQWGLRNSQWTTIAPTGSIAISADCSQGMEPLFAISYGKRISDSNEVWQFVNPVFERLYKDKPWYAKALQEIAANHGSCENCPSIPDHVKNVFVVAHDIDWQDRIKMQAALQRGISNGISSTINLPAGATPEQVEEIYIEAWRAGLKGVTVYVDGCKSNQPVVFGGEQKPQEEEVVPVVEKAPELKRGEIVERPKILDGSTGSYRVGCGKLYITHSYLGDVPMEVFANPSSNGGGCHANIQALGIIISTAIRAGVDENIIREKLNRISCPACKGKNVDAKSCPAAIALAMKELGPPESCWDDLMDWDAIDDEPEVAKPDLKESKHTEPTSSQVVCPDCGMALTPAEGCWTCISCGFSRCS